MTPACQCQVTEIMNSCRRLSVRQSPASIAEALLSLHRDGRPVWKQLKSARLPITVENYSCLRSAVLFGVDLVYGKKHRRDSVSFLHNGTEYCGLLFFLRLQLLCFTINSKARANSLVAESTTRKWEHFSRKKRPSSPFPILRV